MIRLRPELSRSNARGVGRPVTSLKRGLLRLLGQPLDDLAAQASVAVDASLDEARAARSVGEQGLAEARDAREWAQVAITAEAGAREEAQGYVGTLPARIEAIEQAIDRLQLAPRLARLERERRPPGSRRPRPTAVAVPGPLGARGHAGRERGGQLDLSTRSPVRFEGTAGYIAGDELRAAVNVAVALERPLLVRGEPGTGKTLLAEAVAEALGMRLLVWGVKSTTRAQEGLLAVKGVGLAVSGGRADPSPLCRHRHGLSSVTRVRGRAVKGRCSR